MVGGPPGHEGAEAVAPRQRLLDAVVTYFTEEGLADESLRRIAEAIGTSHRMLLYHFGSKDGLCLRSSARWRPGRSGASRTSVPTYPARPTW